jgi:hypothetical protein
MDIQKRNKLVEKIIRQYDKGISIPIVELDEFFDGNTVEHSIAPNNVGYGHPGLQRFWEILRSVRERSDVDHVLVGIHECPEPDDPQDADVWPIAEYVFIYTSASPAEVENWVVELKSEEVGEWPPENEDSRTSLPPPEPEDKIQTLTWD